MYHFYFFHFSFFRFSSFISNNFSQPFKFVMYYIFVLNRYRRNTFETAYVFSTWNIGFLCLFKVSGVSFVLFLVILIKGAWWSRISVSFVETINSVIYIIVIFTKNFIPVNFIETFQFITIKIFKISFISIRFTRWWRFYKIFENNKLKQWYWIIEWVILPDMALNSKLSKKILSNNVFDFSVTLVSWTISGEKNMSI